MESDGFGRKVRWYAKKKWNELKAVTDNLDTFLTFLREGKLPKPFAFGFLHQEPSDVIAIDQKGATSKLTATRLYVYPDIETETLYLLTIGDKASQGRDIQDCVRFVKQLKSRERPEGGKSDGIHDQA